MTDQLRPAIVTDLDREWAIAQKPMHWDRDAPMLPWETHVAEQAERFERTFGDGSRKPYAEWSGLWRRVWWPKADPSILHPRLAPGTPHPFVRRSEQHWSAALAVLTPRERVIAERCGVIQVRPNDPRADVIVGKRAPGQAPKVASSAAVKRGDHAPGKDRDRRFFDPRPAGPKRKNAATLVAKFNAQHPPGTAVRVYPLARWLDDCCRETVVSSRGAFLNGAGTAVVKVPGDSIALSNVIVLEDGQSPSVEVAP